MKVLFVSELAGRKLYGIMNEVQGPKRARQSVRWMAVLKSGFLVLFCLLTALAGEAGPRPSCSGQSESTSATTRDETPLDKLLERAREAEWTGRMAEAEKLALAALQEAEKLGDSSPKLADVLISATGSPEPGPASWACTAT